VYSRVGRPTHRSNRTDIILKLATTVAGPEAVNPVFMVAREHTTKVDAAEVALDQLAVRR
jgi:hypothetical protein